jgi:hypothetical protein
MERMGFERQLDSLVTLVLAMVAFVFEQCL